MLCFLCSWLVVAFPCPRPQATADLSASLNQLAFLELMGSESVHSFKFLNKCFSLNKMFLRFIHVAHYQFINLFVLSFAHLNAIIALISCRHI